MSNKEEYVVVKLLTGEEVMGTIERIDEDFITMSDPIQLHRTLSPTGHTWIVCSDYLLFSHGNILDLRQCDVVFYKTDITQPVIDNYRTYTKVETVHEVSYDDEQKIREYAEHFAMLKKDAKKRSVH